MYAHASGIYTLSLILPSGLWKIWPDVDMLVLTQ